MVQASRLTLASVNSLESVLVRLLARVVVASRLSALVSGVVNVDISVIKSTVGAVRRTVLVEVVGVEHVARSVVGETLGLSLGLVLSVLRNGVVAAELSVEGTREELAAHPVVGSVDGLAAAGGTSAPASTVGAGSGAGRDGNVGLVISVRASDDNLELLAALAHVGGGGSIKVGAPESALVAGHGSRVGAVVTPDCRGSAVVVAWLDGRIALNVHVESSTEVGTVAEGGTLGDIVRLEGVQANVGMCAGRTGQVLESLVVDSLLAGNGGGNSGRDGSRGIRSHGVEGSVGIESRGGVRSRDRAISIRLRSARVLGVDESAVSTLLRGGGARRGGRDGGGSSSVLSHGGESGVVGSVGGSGSGSSAGRASRAGALHGAGSSLDS